MCFQPDYRELIIILSLLENSFSILSSKHLSELGGLHVISAEPNESARIDRQLYGRSTRQGNPGSALGIFSLEDEVLIRYAGKLSTYARKRFANQNPIKSPWMISLLRNSQRGAERLALRQRKRVLKTDRWLDEQLDHTDLGTVCQGTYYSFFDGKIYFVHTADQIRNGL